MRHCVTTAPIPIVSKCLWHAHKHTRTHTRTHTFDKCHVFHSLTLPHSLSLPLSLSLFISTSLSFSPYLSLSLSLSLSHFSSPSTPRWSLWFRGGSECLSVTEHRLIQQETGGIYSRSEENWFRCRILYPFHDK